MGDMMNPVTLRRDQFTYPITRQTQSAEAVMPKQVVFCRSRSFETGIEYYASKCRRWRRGHGIFTTAQCDVTRGEGILWCGRWKVECGVYEHVCSFMWLKLSGV